MKLETETAFVICIQNEGYLASLEIRKIYQRLPDDEAAKHQLLRVVDESGEHYLYPEAYFMHVDLPLSVQEVLLRAA